jgi:hypothetical protein
MGDRDKFILRTWLIKAFKAKLKEKSNEISLI